MNKNNLNNNYSYYFLHKIKNNKTREWKLDCRLENITLELSDNLLIYLIKLFRRYYSDFFHDNLYRNGFKSTCSLMNNDCEQILQNMFIICDFYRFNRIVREIIREFATVEEKNLTVDDVIKIKTDDILQKERFEKNATSDVEKTIKDFIRNLFDEIKDEDIDEIYNERMQYFYL
jgi:hypothetical protein